MHFLRLLFTLCFGCSSCLFSEYYTTIEQRPEGFYLNSYEAPDGFAQGVFGHRLGHHALDQANSSSKIDIAKFGLSWEKDQVVVSVKESDKVRFFLFETPGYKSRNSLLKSSEFEVTFEQGKIAFYDFVTQDELKLGYDQIQLFVLSEEARLYRVTLVAPVKPGGQWRQSNWQRMPYKLDLAPFEVIAHQKESFQVFAPKRKMIQNFHIHDGLSETKLESELQDPKFLNSTESRFSLLDQQQGLVEVRQVGKQLKSNDLEFASNVVDVVSYSRHNLKTYYESYSDWERGSFKKLNLEGELLVDWLREEDSFVHELKVRYIGEGIRQRDQVRWEIWWDVPSPSIDLRRDLRLADESGWIRKPIAHEDEFEFRKTLKWPFDKFKRDAGQDYGHENRWTILKLSSADGAEVRYEIPWRGRPLSLASNRIQDRVTWDALPRAWKRAGGKEVEAPFFAGALSTDKVPSSLGVYHPWGIEIGPSDVAFEPLWVKTWSHLKDRFDIPMMKEQGVLFDTIQVQVTNPDGKAVQVAEWRAINEFGDVLCRFPVYNGLYRKELSEVGSDNPFQKFWDSNAVHLVIEGVKGEIFEAHREKKLSGKELLAHWWVEHQEHLALNYVVPWGQGYQAWEPEIDLFHFEGKWRLSFRDQTSSNILLKRKDRLKESSHVYSSDLGHFSIPLEESASLSLQNLSFSKQNAEGVSSQKTKGISLTGLEKPSLLKHAKGNNFWMVDQHRRDLMSWQGLDCKRVQGIPLSLLQGLIAIDVDLLGNWYLLHQQDRRSELWQVNLNYPKNDQVLGRVQSGLKKPNDLIVHLNGISQKVLVCDPGQHAILAFDEAWSLQSKWDKLGFQPVAMVKDPVEPNRVWVLDRRENGQSFLYWFKVVPDGLELEKVILTPLALAGFEGSMSKGFAIQATKKGGRLLAFCDQKHKRVVEYYFDGQNLSQLKPYSQSIPEHGFRSLQNPRELVYLKEYGKDMLYVLDGTDSFFRVK